MALTNVDLDRIDGNSGTLANVNTVSLNGGPLSGARNRIINGDMRIDQRNAGASVANINGYSIDRWVSFNVANSFSAQRSTTTPAGFTNSLLFTTTTSATPAASDYRYLAQFIEGVNVADLSYGTSSAVTTTLSFYVRSSLTGTFSGALKNNAENRSYPFTFSITSADTFEYKTITIPGDTSGTWLTNTGIGLRVVFDLGSGSSRRGTADAWAGANNDGVTGAVSLVGTSGATFYITGVQLEAGSVATPFERRSYGQELALCQRYFQYFPAGAFGRWNSSISAELANSFSVPMRTTPSLSINPNDDVCNIFRVGIATNQCTVSSLNSAYMSPTGGIAAISVSSTASTPSAGDGAAYDPDSDSHVIFCSAEL